MPPSHSRDYEKHTLFSKKTYQQGKKGTVASDAVNGPANLIAHTPHTPEGVST